MYRLIYLDHLTYEVDCLLATFYLYHISSNTNIKLYQYRMCTGLLFSQVRPCFASPTSVRYLALRYIDSTLQRQNANKVGDGEEEAVRETRPVILDVFKLLLLARLYIKDALVAIRQEWSKCFTFSSVFISFTLLCTLSQINSEFISTSTVHLTAVCSQGFDKPLSVGVKNCTGVSQ